MPPSLAFWHSWRCVEILFIGVSQPRPSSRNSSILCHLMDFANRDWHAVNNCKEANQMFAMFRKRSPSQSLSAKRFILTYKSFRAGPPVMGVLPTLQTHPDSKLQGFQHRASVLKQCFKGLRLEILFLHKTTPFFGVTLLCTEAA